MAATVMLTCQHQLQHQLQHQHQHQHQQASCHLPNSPSDDSRVFAELGRIAACPSAAGEEDSVSGIAMEQQHHEQHSIRLKRAAAASASISGGSVGGGGTPAGLSPGGLAPTLTAAASPAATTRSGGGPTATSGRLRQPLHFTFDFREPDQMEEPRAQRLLRKFRERMGAKCAKYELVAGFHLEDGVILSYHRFRTRIHFELTERRRKILCRYYRQGQQEVLLYVDRSEFEYYSPVCCYQPPPQRQQQQRQPLSDGRGGGGGGKRQDGGSGGGSGKGSSATSCFAISGCAS